MVLINYRPQSYAFFGNRQNQQQRHSAHNRSEEFENDVLNKWVAKVALRHLLHRLTAESRAEDWGEDASIPLMHSGYGGKKGEMPFWGWDSAARASNFASAFETSNCNY